MLYRKYELYDGKMEIMLPSSLRQVSEDFVEDYEENRERFRIGDALYSQYMWISKDRRTAVNITQSGMHMDDGKLVMRLQEYFLNYRRDTHGFSCEHVKKRNINGWQYGEMRYFSEIMGYSFYHILLVGSFRGDEWIMNLQCLDKNSEQYKHAFTNITDSIYIKKNG